MPIQNPRERFGSVENLSLIEGDLGNREFVTQILDTHEPDVVLHAAAQPSAPYYGERALYTQPNNVSMNVSPLHGLSECGLDDTHFIETTTTVSMALHISPYPRAGSKLSAKAGRTRYRFQR